MNEPVPQLLSTLADDDVIHISAGADVAAALTNDVIIISHLYNRQTNPFTIPNLVIHAFYNRGGSTPGGEANSWC